MTRKIKQGYNEPLATDLSEFQLGFSTLTNNLYTKHGSDIIRFFKYEDDFHHIQTSMNFDDIIANSPIGYPPNGVTGSDTITSQSSINELENAAPTYSRNIFIEDYQIKILVYHSVGTTPTFNHRVYLKSNANINKDIVFKSSFNNTGLDLNFSPQPLNSSQTIHECISKTIEPGSWRLLSHDNLYYWTDVLTLSLSDPDCQLTIKYAKIVNEIASLNKAALEMPDGNLTFDVVFNKRIPAAHFSENLRII
jgi:hypothetical protein